MEIQPMIEGQFFHIYNCGMNSEDLFKEKKNYYYFLKQFFFYCGEVLDTYAGCLLKNHFHLVAYVKENVQVPRKNGEGMFRLNASKQLSHFFNSYAQSINKMYWRTGPLFESPFERKLIDTPDYLRLAICYCHHNPQLHGFIEDFRDWEHSSYHNIIINDNTLVASQKVIEKFGDTARFEEAHKIISNHRGIQEYRVEYE